MIFHWFFAISVSHGYCPLFYASSTFHLLVSISQRDRFIEKNFSYSEYYSSKNFDGISGGYLNSIAAVTYDTVTRFATSPNEMKRHQKVIAKIIKKP